MGQSTPTVSPGWDRVGQSTPTVSPGWDRVDQSTPTVSPVLWLEQCGSEYTDSFIWFGQSVSSVGWQHTLTVSAV